MNFHHAQPDHPAARFIPSANPMGGGGPHHHHPPSAACGFAGAKGTTANIDLTTEGLRGLYAYADPKLAAVTSAAKNQQATTANNRIYSGGVGPDYRGSNFKHPVAALSGRQPQHNQPLHVGGGSSSAAPSPLPEDFMAPPPRASQMAEPSSYIDLVAGTNAWRRQAAVPRGNVPPPGQQAEASNSTSSSVPMAPGVGMRPSSRGNDQQRLPTGSPLPVANNRKRALTIAGEFTWHYFHLMQSKPEMLHCFYCRDSQVAHGSSLEVHDKWHRAFGDEEIGKLFEQILASKDETCAVGPSNIIRSNVKTLEAQLTKDDGIVMQATGVIETRDKGPRPFAHTIVMKKALDAGSYVVLHDIFVFIDDCCLAASQPTGRPAAAVDSSADTAVVEAGAAAVELTGSDKGSSSAPSKQTPETAAASGSAALSQTEATEKSEACVIVATSPVNARRSVWKQVNKQQSAATAAAPPAEAQPSSTKATDSANVASAAETSTSQEEMPIMRTHNISATSWAGRVLVGLSANSKLVSRRSQTNRRVQKGTVVKMTPATADPSSTSASQDGQPTSASPQTKHQQHLSSASAANEEMWSGKSVWVSQLDGVLDSQIEAAVENRLRGCPVEGRVVRIERMRNGPAGVIELDSAECVPLLLERGLCLNGREVRVDMYKQSPSQITRDPKGGGGNSNPENSNNNTHHQTFASRREGARQSQRDNENGVMTSGRVRRQAGGAGTNQNTTRNKGGAQQKVWEGGRRKQQQTDRQNETSK